MTSRDSRIKVVLVRKNVGFLISTTFLVAHLIHAAPGGHEFYERGIRPLLAKHCYKCHSEAKGKAKGGLTLDHANGWENGGDSGPAVKPGDPNASMLVEAVRYTDPDFQMPPKYQLSDDEIKSLERWVKIGAPGPQTADAHTDHTRPDPASTDDGDFWAFKPIDPKSAPPASDPEWNQHPVDRYLFARMREAKVTPSPRTNRAALIRRASFALCGLPPESKEIERFCNDPEDDATAFAKVTDRLLASPRFGERWGRHWLDVVRYAESMGRTRNIPFPYAWQYRNYVIASFNADKPYDVFVREQLAGDLMAENTDDPLEQDRLRIASGFLALGAHDLNERNQEKFFMDVVDDQIDVTGRAFLGLTTGCARCHDHKFDPIPTKDYYALAGIFRSTETLGGYATRQGGSKNYLHTDKLVKLAAYTPAPGPAPTKKPATAPGRQKRLKSINRQIRQAEAELKEEEAANKKKKLQRRLASLRKQRTQINRKEKNQGANLPLPPAGMAMTARDRDKPVNCMVRIRGEIGNRGDLVPRGVLTRTPGMPPRTIPKKRSGRLELADWLADTRHPLTARVIVNRIWHHLFGRGIVETVDNFGRMGSRPSHPELLDHLANRFIENGWSTKQMIRYLTFTRVYQGSGDIHPANMETDPSNRLLWRMPLLRLEAEALRDAMLMISGRMDHGTPDSSAVMSAPVRELRRLPNQLVGTAAHRRSVYLPVLRGHLPEMFEAFDFAEPTQVMGRRNITTVPTQALFMLNDAFVQECARNAAMHRVSKGQAVEDRIRSVWTSAFARTPSETELHSTARFIQVTTQTVGETEAWTQVFQSLFASAEFRYVP